MVFTLIEHRSKIEISLSKWCLKMSSGRYKTNPFVDSMLVPVKGKQVRISKLGDDNNILVNQSTGEIHGTHVTTFKKVDSEQFVKVFTANIGLTFDLSSAGIKAFSVLFFAVQKGGLGRDQVDLDVFTLEEFTELHKDREPPLRLSHPTFMRGLAELVKAQIIAKSMRQGRYFINPNFIFNGDRIAFTTVIERQKREEQCELQLE
jgi:hypothetical protein